jgi:hypothetical protein
VTLGEPIRFAPLRFASPMRSEHRDAQDDFFCLRYQVWYPSFDCAARTRFKTCDGCRDCQQGRFNLKRHAGELRATRLNIAFRT